MKPYGESHPFSGIFEADRGVEYCWQFDKLLSVTGKRAFEEPLDLRKNNKIKKTYRFRLPFSATFGAIVGTGSSFVAVNTVIGVSLLAMQADKLQRGTKTKRSHTISSGRAKHDG